MKTTLIWLNFSGVDSEYKLNNTRESWVKRKLWQKKKPMGANNLTFEVWQKNRVARNSRGKFLQKVQVTTNQGVRIIQVTKFPWIKETYIWCEVCFISCTEAGSLDLGFNKNETPNVYQGRLLFHSLFFVHPQYTRPWWQRRTRAVTSCPLVACVTLTKYLFCGGPSPKIGWLRTPSSTMLFRFYQFVCTPGFVAMLLRRRWSSLGRGQHSAFPAPQRWERTLLTSLFITWFVKVSFTDVRY